MSEEPVMSSAARFKAEVDQGKLQPTIYSLAQLRAACVSAERGELDATLEQAQALKKLFHSMLVTAFHEAGHGVTGAAVGLPPNRIFLHVDDSVGDLVFGGGNQYSADVVDEQRNRLLDYATVTAAGGIAEGHYFGTVEDGNDDDNAKTRTVLEMAGAFTPSVVGEVVGRAQTIIAENGQALEAIVRALELEGSLEGEELAKLLAAVKPATPCPWNSLSAGDESTPRMGK